MKARPATLLARVRSLGLGLLRLLGLGLLGTLALGPACSGGAPGPATISHHAEPVLVALRADRDGDRIPDDQDGCPGEPEDFDLFQDGDGCPDRDDDHDGVPDLADACFDTPGTAGGGCPDGCVIVTNSSDCWGGPIWFETSPPSTVAAIKQVFDDLPEIETVTLTTYALDGEPPGIARGRLERARRALIAGGVPAAKLALIAEVPLTDSANVGVYGQVTRQRFEAGKFRTTLCAGDMGSVYRVSRERNYHCKPRICGDGECYPPTEDKMSCPRDCPP